MISVGGELLILKQRAGGMPGIPHFHKEVHFLNILVKLSLEHAIQRQHFPFLHYTIICAAHFAIKWV
jgi:hypothetical protein